MTPATLYRPMARRKKKRTQQAPPEDLSAEVVAAIRAGHSLDWETVKAIRAGRIDAPLPPDFFGPGFQPRRTKALPNTPEKVEVISRRYDRREALFSPQDAVPDAKARKKRQAPSRKKKRPAGVLEALAPSRYFVWQRCPGAPYRCYAAKNFPEPPLGDPACIWRGESYPEGYKVALEATRELQANGHLNGKGML